MLKSLQVTNFKSFKEENTFSLVKNEKIDILEENVRGDIVKGLLFVGPNASGKTNSISAINALLEIALSNCNLNKYVNIFYKETMHINYVFAFDKDEVTYKISYNPLDKTVFEEFFINKTKSFSNEGGLSSGLKQYLEENEENVIIKKFLTFLRNSSLVDLYDGKQSEDISDFKNPNIIYNDYVVTEMNDFLTTNGFEFTVTKNDGKDKKEDLFFIKDGIDVHIPYEMESIGNKTLMYIFPIMKKTIKNGGMLLLDEFGSGMHNELEELLVRYFMKNSKNAQLFFVSHSTNLLSQNLLRADQIYSIDYENGGSVSYRFSSELPRSGQNLEKMYLGGVFGGLPNYNKKQY